MKVTVLNLGCKVNQAECTEMKAGFIASGYRVIDLSDKPDLCVINTCSVTAKSDYQSRQLIRRAHRSGARVIVTGCYADLNEDAVSRMEGVEKVFSNCKKTRIVEEITGSVAGEPFPQSFNGRSRYFLKVQDGCNYSCSYCLIPKARGKSKSLPLDTIVGRAQELSSQYEEIVLTGIHLGTYGYDLIPQVSLSQLVRTLLLQTSIGRIRLTSLEINELDDELYDLLSDPRVCKHLHIPLQSGADRILKLMKRGYNAERFLDVIRRIRLAHPDASIGTDVIAGFPTEGEEDFRKTYDLIASLPFTYLHVFPFSQRPGTAASLLTPQVAENVKRERVTQLSALGMQKRSAFMKSQVGKTLTLLAETECEDGTVLGTTGNYLKVRVPLDPRYLRNTVRVEITGFEGDVLIAVPINSL